MKMQSLEDQAFTLGDEGRIYFDHNATTALAKDLLPLVSKWIYQWGNPSSIHQSGRGPKTLIRESRQNIAKFLGASQLELVFTSGGSESNNTVLRGVFADPKLHKNRKTLMISAVEHPSIEKVAVYLEKYQGIKVMRIPVSKDGVLDFEFFEKNLNEDVALVSVMMANNETGHIFPIKKMVKRAHKVGALFHTDAVQTLGKLEVNLGTWAVDFASFSGHKFYALKGVGLLYVRKGLNLPSLIIGGAQERKRRAGTENVLSIASLGAVCKMATALTDKIEYVRELRDLLESEIEKKISDVHFTGRDQKRLCSTSSMTIAGVDGESLLMSLDLEGISVSTGAACSSGNPEPSPVLLAMGFSRAEAQSSLRIGLGWGNNKAEVLKFVEVLNSVVVRLRSFK